MNISILFTNNQVTTLNFDTLDKAHETYQNILANIELALKKKRYLSIDLGASKHSYNPDSIMCVLLQDKTNEPQKDNEKVCEQTDEGC